MSDTLPVIALVVSLASLALSFVSYRQSKNTESLALRREAINHVRTAFLDVVLDDDAGELKDFEVRPVFLPREPEPIASDDGADQHAELVFSDNVKNPLTQAHAATSRLQNTPIERQTNRYRNEKATLGNDLDTALERMNKEANIVGWLAWL